MRKRAVFAKKETMFIRRLSSAVLMLALLLSLVGPGSQIPQVRAAAAQTTVILDAVADATVGKHDHQKGSAHPDRGRLGRVRRGGVRNSYLRAQLEDSKEVIPDSDNVADGAPVV